MARAEARGDGNRLLVTYTDHRNRSQTVSAARGLDDSDWAFPEDIRPSLAPKPAELLKAARARGERIPRYR